MTTCAEVRDLLLEAEPEELRGHGASPVAEHLRTCPGCARLAAAILEETAQLEAWLEAEPSVPVAEILTRAGIPVGPRPTLRLPRRSRWVWAPAAAAAAIAVLFVAIESRAPRPLGAPRATPPEAPPLVEATGGETVAVIQTDNPDITVLWFF